jgi:hypothetical protein
MQTLEEVKLWQALKKEAVYWSPWRRGVVVVASASRPEDPEFESRQGVRFYRP